MNTRIRTTDENEDHPNIAIIIGSMADLCEDTQLFVKMAYYELAVAKLELNSNVLELRHDLVSYIEKLYSIYETSDDYDNALKCLERKLSIQQEYFPPEHIDIVKTWSQKGFLYQKLPDYSQMAYVCFAQALTLYDSVERDDETEIMRDHLIQLVMHELMHMRDSTP
ncbi:unnamed protein product [Rotaria sp. Silwood2]|nr:unnamed protein product [Rotaria sp. Silwood2]